MLLCPYCKKQSLVRDSWKDRKTPPYKKANYLCSNCKKQTVNPIVDGESALEQKSKDQNRIHRAKIRIKNRKEYLNDDKMDTIIGLLERYKPTVPSHRYTDDNGRVGVIQLNDWHMGLRVKQAYNQFDFYIAAKALKKLYYEAISVFSAYDIENVVLLFGGDLVNSDRRQSEILANVANKEIVTMLTFDLCQQFISDMAQYYGVYVANVVGNESRNTKDRMWIPQGATDNRDFALMNRLKHYFSDTTIQFKSGINSNIIHIGDNFTGLLIHGETVGSGNVESRINAIISKYARQGTIINYVWFAHIHAPLISDYYARSASLVGGEPYANDALHKFSKKSQNIFTVSEDGSINCMSIDLQNLNNIDGYKYNSFVMEEFERVKFNGM